MASGNRTIDQTSGISGKAVHNNDASRMRCVRMGQLVARLPQWQTAIARDFYRVAHGLLNWDAEAGVQGGDLTRKPHRTAQTG